MYSRFSLCPAPGRSVLDPRRRFPPQILHDLRLRAEASFASESQLRFRDLEEVVDVSVLADHRAGLRFFEFSVGRVSEKNNSWGGRL